MINDGIELAIDILDYLANRGVISRFIDDVLIAINTAVTFLPRIGLVMGYVSYFVDWPLVLPLLILGTVALTCRLAIAIIGVLVSLAHSILDSIPVIG